MSAQTATVETLTAEVRVLMVGNRQVTLSVYRQLDHVAWPHVVPFGRVNAGLDHRQRSWAKELVHVVGRYNTTLVRSSIPVAVWRHDYQSDESYGNALRTSEEWKRLPLIVLAGLK